MKRFCIITAVLAATNILGNALIDNIYATRSMNEPNVRINGRTFLVEVADEPFEHINGLSGHVPLLGNQGMIFVFADKQVRRFWMKDMLFPLDIIWIEDGTIVKIDKELAPEGKQPDNHYSSLQPVNYVLEINAGLADQYGFKIGDKADINL